MRSPPIPALAVLAALTPFAASAQAILGTVMDEADGRPIATVHLALVDEDGNVGAEALSDEEGEFRLDAPEPGPWYVAADVIGYGPLRSGPVVLPMGEVLSVEVRLAVEAIALEPLVVTGRVNRLAGDIAAFYGRMQRGRRSGLGTFISRADIEDRNALEASDLFRGTASVRVVSGRGGYGDLLRMAGGCTPAIFIDGAHINRLNPNDSLDDYVSIDSIEGVEIYRGAMSHVDRFFDPRGCGLILVWTRRGTADPDNGPFSWTRLLAGLGLIGALFLIK